MYPIILLLRSQNNPTPFVRVKMANYFAVPVAKIGANSGPNPARTFGRIKTHQWQIYVVIMGAGSVHFLFGQPF